MGYRIFIFFSLFIFLRHNVDNNTKKIHAAPCCSCIQFWFLIMLIILCFNRMMVLGRTINSSFINRVKRIETIYVSFQSQWRIIVIFSMVKFQNCVCFFFVTIFSKRNTTCTNTNEISLLLLSLVQKPIQHTNDLLNIVCVSQSKWNRLQMCILKHPY